MTRLLIVSPDVVGERMAGVGIRYWHLSAALARKGIDVTLATPGDPPPVTEGFRVVTYDTVSDRSLAPYTEGQDALLVSGYVLSSYPALKQSQAPLIVDLWAPFVLENLEVYGNQSLTAQAALHRNTVRVVNEQLEAGDLFLCASERQRDFWLGMLATNHRLNPYTYADDPTFERLLALVPFGLPAGAAQHTRAVLKGAKPGVGELDRVILWSGGIWDWYDPLTLIRAVGLVLDVREDVKLVFLGVRHPNPEVSSGRRLDEAIALCQELGLYDRHVFFTEWVPYDEMQNYLLEADIGAVLHHRHIETRFSFRARILGYIWAALPILITEGSPSSDIVREEGLGRVVGYEDSRGTANALLEMLSLSDLRSCYRPRFVRARERFAWDHVVQPIVEFCAHPRRAPDKDERIRAAEHAPGAERTPYWQLPARAWEVLRDKGIGGVAREVRSYARWWYSQRG